MGVLLVANLANTVAEFAGAGAALGILGVPSLITVPVVAVAIWALVLFANYRTVEKVFLAVMLVFVAYIASAVLAGPDWGEVGRALVTPDLSGLDPALLLLMVAVVGTTITPYMQFYLQSAVAEKGIDEEELGLEQADAVVGSIWTNVIAVFIVVATATTLYAHRHDHQQRGRRRGRARPGRRRAVARCSSRSASSGPACWRPRSCR